jgi:NAD(P)-dependent dehydrogenase (short-subunit alcohol dehydrogenase family)
VGRMTGKVALVTGAASAAGLGFATAQRLHAEGARVMLTDIDGDAVAARAGELGEGATALRQDVTDGAQWTTTVAAVTDRYGKLDVLVNNAGIAVLRAMEDLEPADWSRQIEVNLTSVYLGCRAALMRMRAQGGGGSIVNLSSVAGLVGVAGCAAYAASKGGVRVMSKVIALEGAAENIRCNSVHPGMIWTDMQKVAIADNKEIYDEITAAIPMKRMGEPADIAAMILFLASDEAKYITGGEFVVDGGMTAQ